jgi:putative phosphoesterase
MDVPSSQPAQPGLSACRIGVLSDTHGFLDPCIPALFTGVNHILHAGDVGWPWVLAELERLAPVTAVAGNTDLTLSLRQVEVVEVAGLRILLQHALDLPRPPAATRRLLQRDRPHVVVFGHTHAAYCQRLEGTLYFNPGYAGPVRGRTRRTIGILHSGPGGIRPEFCDLPG